MESSSKPRSKLITQACRVLDTAIDATVVLSYGNTGYRFRRATLWKDADPDLPILKQARAEYAKLQ